MFACKIRNPRIGIRNPRSADKGRNLPLHGLIHLSRWSYSYRCCRYFFFLFFFVTKETWVGQTWNLQYQYSFFELRTQILYNNAVTECQVWPIQVRCGTVIHTYDVSMKGQDLRATTQLNCVKGRKCTLQQLQNIVLTNAALLRFVIIVPITAKTGRFMYFRRILGEVYFLHYPPRTFIYYNCSRNIFWGEFKSQIALVFVTLFTFLKFAGNLVAIRPRFHAYVVSVYSLSSHDWGNWGEGENELRSRYWIIIRFWETAHLPLPKANILPQVRSKC